ncbi:MAG: hypothetical protein STSR0008_11390 [Ignavibacterium sp.]
MIMQNEFQNAQLMIEEVEQFSNNKLKLKNDLFVIVNSAIKNNLNEKLNDLAFTSKYVKGLMRVLFSGQNNPEVKNIEQIQSDLSNNIQKTIEMIKNILIYESSEVQEEFQKKFFNMNSESFGNLDLLLSDLEWLKMYLNDLKRS